MQIPIANAFEAFKAQFREIFAGMPEDTTEENMQSRLRGMILMSLSNKFGHILLTTGNKSELAVGYCTIYGDMAGGLAVISDVPKTMVYDLARWINSDVASWREREIIPKSTIEKPPSAELKPGQVDQDTLPPYDILDEILRLYVEENLSARDIIAHGFDEKTVRWVQRRVDLNEYKREQAAPGNKSNEPRLRPRPPHAHRAKVRRLIFLCGGYKRSAFAKATARQSSLFATTRAKTGGKGIRTPDFQLAKLALYQLSYAPTGTPNAFACSRLMSELPNFDCRLRNANPRESRLAVLR